MTIRSILVLCIILFTLESIAQDAADEETGTWYILSSNHRVTDKLTIDAQTQLRFFELASELQQFKVRVGATYNFNSIIGVTGGYGYFRNDFSYLSDTPEAFTEHRTYEDVHIRNALGKLRLLHRYRLEQRYIQGPGASDFQQWMRYQLKLVYPLSEQWSIDVYDEVFINLEEPFFAQNWLGTGVTYRFLEHLKARIGFQKIHFDGPDFERILIGINWTTDFRRSNDNDS
ncbi:DUF2490 domain-containing protein [Altibacter sp. HG106]|uniref:DUF2490 domain-containing protein n=1 Tax=Altibacter sp. HG106 TaxID=3023937 RepID=UPI002350C90A|nr:DUF2490 domain-containing protein [Altibacter sp. HG106]MDC7993808.1 DUF2490 domain-containing protein [Altibacter sp. HG106]